MSAPNDENENAADGVLVVDDEAGISWWSPRWHAVARVDLRLGPGVAGVVDAARTDRLLAWAVDPGAAVDPLVAAVDTALDLAGLLTELRAGGPSVTTMPGLQLTAAGRRYAYIAALDRCLLYPVDRGALLIDEAEAALAMGRRRSAEDLFDHAEYALVDLAERAIDGGLPGLLVGRLRDALQHAARLGVAEEATELAGEIPDPATLADSDLAGTLAAWLDAEQSPTISGPAVLGALDDEMPELTADGYLDIAAVPPRILAWNGAESPDLRIDHLPDRDRFVISAPLAAGVDPTCREAGELLAWTTDRETGRLVAVAPMTVRDGAVVGELPAGGRELYEIEAGIAGGGSEPGGVPAGPAWYDLVLADRALFESWNHYRAALATVGAVGPDAGAAEIEKAERDRDRRLGYARTAAQGALDTFTGLLADRADDRADSDDPIVTRLRGRAAAVAAYLAGLYDPPLPGTEEPALVELLVPAEEDGR